MARNNYYATESLPDDQFVSNYATNVPTSPSTSNGAGYVGPTEAPSEVNNSGGNDGGYVPTVSMEDDYVPTEVDNSDSSIHSSRLVVGWLVCTKGASIGQDYRLHVGWNYIGRDRTQDIVLSDPAVSHHMAKVCYDPESCTFGVAPSEGAKSLCYLNSKPLRGDRDFEAYDILRIGNTELLLIPLCGERFKWAFDKA